MFFRRKSHKRKSNPVFVIFRLFLSLAIFAVLLGGIYSAYKQFSGTDPMQLSPKAVIANFSSPEKITVFMSGLLSIGNNSKNVILGRSETNSGSNQILKPASRGEQVQDDAADSRTVSQGKQARITSAVSFKFALVADSHNENANLAKALNQVKENKAQFVIGLGDYTEVGTLSELENAKAEFDKAGIRYFVTAGDHDLWDSRNKSLPPLSNFNQVFGPSNQSFSFGNAKILILDDSDNYLGLGEPQMEWLSGQLSMVKNQPEINVVFALLHEPLYHPSSSRVMGKVTESLKPEAKKLIKLLKDNGIKEVFAGDIHFFTKYTEPETGLSMTTIGALTSLRNTQEPRFGLVTVYEDGTYEVEEVEVK